ncbi:hypothetical protein OS493_008990 [Desmophyllum pertusum]|uniref:Uncharacterized protein n=1 Tax=Desmophyllum pertusum TaxID=174260 RepID=A0A9W9ZFJ7_9CNID|nr:hypothetical protein OS493_008990 [Desmophyllum pertusum]
MSSCVLCGNCILKNSDKNLVDGWQGTAFNVRVELSSLDFKVVINSAYICRNCLATLKKRRALLANLQDVNTSLHKIINSKSSNCSLPVSASPKPSLCTVLPKPCSNRVESDFQEQPTKRVALEDLRASDQRHDRDVSSGISVEQFPVSGITSTPPFLYRQLPLVKLRRPFPTQRRHVFRSQSNGGAKPNTTIYTKVLSRLARCSAVERISRSLELFGENPILKKHVQQLFLQEVDRECTALCSLKNPSCLRSPKKEDLQSFSFKKFNSELESKAPLFSAVRVHGKVKEKDEFWTPSVCMSAAVLLKNRSPCMNAMQLLNTIILYHTGIIGTLCRLGALRVTTGHTYYYRKLDEFGKEFAASVEKKVKDETDRLKKKHEVSSMQPVVAESDQQPPAEHQAVVILPADKGRKLVFDNFDFKTTSSCNDGRAPKCRCALGTHMAVENRVSGNHLSDKKPDVDGLLQMENGQCLPSRRDHHLQRENYITLTERAITEIPCLAFLKPVVCKHIPHQYSKEMREKSEMSFLGMLYHNENDADGIQQVLTGSPSICPVLWE